MSKYLSDLDIRADKAIVDEFKGGFVQRFGRQTCCITTLYRSLLKRTVATNDVPKVIVTCVNAPSNSNIAPVIETALVIRWPFHFREYIEAKEQKKKTMLADALRDCLLLCAEKWHWDKAAILKADAQARAKSLNLEGTSKASWLSPDGQYRVRVAFIWNLDSIEFTAILFHNRSSKVLARKKLGDTVPGWAQLHHSIKAANGKWSSNVEFQLTTSDWLQKSWTVSFSDIIHMPSRS